MSTNMTFSLSDPLLFRELFRTGFFMSTGVSFSGDPSLMLSERRAARVRFLPVGSTGLDEVRDGGGSARIVDMKSRAAITLADIDEQFGCETNT